MAEKIIVTLEVNAKSGVASVQGVEQAVAKANKATKETGAEIFDLEKKLDELSRGSVTTFKTIVKGTQAGIKSMGLLRTAVAATGIGLLVLAAAALVEYFTNFEKPLRIVDITMNAIGGAINAIVDNFGKLVSGDFIGFFTSVGEATMDAVDATNALYDAQERIFEIQKRTIVQNAELRAQLEEGQKIAGDTTLSLEERLKGQEAVNRSSEQLIENERELTRVELERLQAELAIENNYKARRELEIQIAETTANLINVEAELNRQRLDAAKAEREIIAQDQANKDTALKEEQERIKALIEERNTAILAIEDAIRTANEREIFAVRQKYDTLIADARKYGQDTVALEKLRRDELRALTPEGIDPLQQFMDEKAKELEIEKMSALDKLRVRTDAEQAISDSARKGADLRAQLDQQEAQAKLSVFGGLATALSQLFGQQTRAAKAGAIAAATISTYSAAAAAIAAPPIGFGPTPVGFAALATALATGFAQVRNIVATPIPGGGGGSFSGGAPAPSAPSIGSSIGLINPNEGGNQIGEGFAQSVRQRPIKAYVTASDVISGTDLENRIRANGQFE